MFGICPPILIFNIKNQNILKMANISTFSDPLARTVPTVRQGGTAK